MTDSRIGYLLCLAGAMALASACGDMAKGNAERGYSAGESYDYGASDADTDADTDADSDVDADEPPEIERELNTFIPQGAGRYVFVSDEARDSVVVVDSDTLEILTVEVGSRPTHLVTLPGDETRVAVINLNSDEVTVVTLNADETFDLVDIPVRPDTNALSPSPDGKFVIAYHDPEQTEISGAPNTDQEISILRVEPGNELSMEQSVGQHPWNVVYNEDVTKAFVVTEGGINVIDLSKYEDNVRVAPVSLFESGSYNRITADIEITPDGSLALGRRSGYPELVTAALDGKDDTRTYTLPAPPTDLDISRDGSFGMMVFRDLGEVAFFDLPLPEDPATNPFTYVSLEGRVVGLASISTTGNRILLHVSEVGTAQDRSRLTLMSRNENGWEISSAILERPIEAVAMVDVEGEEPLTAVVEHKAITPLPGEKPYGYSLVTLPGLMGKLQQLDKPQGQLLLVPDGEFGFLLVPDDDRMEKIDLDTLIVDPLTFSSSPVAAGYAAATDKVFVTQNHPSGRMSFIGVHEASFKTVTGYALNDEIEVSE